MQNRSCQKTSSLAQIKIMVAKERISSQFCSIRFRDNSCATSFSHASIKRWRHHLKIKTTIAYLKKKSFINFPLTDLLRLRDSPLRHTFDQLLLRSKKNALGLAKKWIFDLKNQCSSHRFTKTEILPCYTEFQILQRLSNGLLAFSIHAKSEPRVCATFADRHARFGFARDYTRCYQHTQTKTTSSLLHELRHSVRLCGDGVMNRLRHVFHIMGSDSADVNSSTVQKIDVVFRS